MAQEDQTKQSEQTDASKAKTNWRASLAGAGLIIAFLLAIAARLLA